MGIQGLLPLLKSIQRPTELKKYDGETFAVDAYGWLHRGAISCAMELAQGKPTRRYVDSVLNRVRMVQHFGITPYLVFDGDYLPSKASTEASRAKRREGARKAGEELLKAGNSKQAFFEFQKAIDITPEMARHVIEELKKMGLPYIVAPYEADAQMVYLERQGLVSGIISEDSDLLVFGAKRLLTKLDMHGHCIEINRRDFCACREISLTDWTDREFRHMAILSGCDYLEGIGNLGLKTAYRMIRKHKTVEKIVRMLQFDGKFKVHENYLTGFRQAELTFLHQRVFCPVKQELTFLTEPPAGLEVDGLRFIGQKIDNDVARGVAVGDLSPFTKDPIVVPLSPGKKRRASSISGSNTPITPAPPHSQSFSGKSIDQYFGKRRDSSAQRIPLGAMDPNCFSVDRKQVAELTQNGLVPRVFPLPRPYVEGGRTSLSQDSPSTTPAPRIRRRQTEPLSSLLSLDPVPATTNTAGRRKTHSMVPPPPPPPRAKGPVQTSVTRPQKKARLSDDEDEEQAPKKSLERSKYFSVAPAATNDSKQKRRNTDGFIMSDDSIEEAMMSLPDLGSWDSPVRPSKVKVFVDTPKTESSVAGDMTGGSTAISRGDDIEVPASPASNIAQPPKVTPLGRQGLGRFSYAPVARMAHGLPTPESSFSQGTRPSASKKPNTLTPPSTAGQSISRRRNSPRKSLSDLVETASPIRVERPRKNNKLRRSFGPPLPANPSFVPLPPADLNEVEALNSAQGSEDQIVPDSDGEEEEADSSETKSGARLDLSRFLCS